MDSTPATPEALAGALAAAVGRLRRSLNRRVRAASGTPSPLPEAQVEILRLVRREPGLRVHDVAAQLQLAPNTVSTLVQLLSAEGMVERLRDPDDGRVTRLGLLPPAEERLRRWHDLRREILAHRLSELDAGDREAVGRAVPVLEKIAISLEGVLASGEGSAPAAQAAGAAAETSHGGLRAASVAAPGSSRG